MWGLGGRNEQLGGAKGEVLGGEDVEGTQAGRCLSVSWAECREGERQREAIGLSETVPGCTQGGRLLGLAEDRVGLGRDLLPVPKSILREKRAFASLLSAVLFPSLGNSNPSQSPGKPLIFLPHPAHVLMLTPLP